MKPQSIVVIVLAVIAIGAAVVLTRGGGDDNGGTSTGGTSSTETSAKAPANAERISFVVSPEKEELLKPVVQAFNDTATQADGKPVFVEMVAMNSGDARTRSSGASSSPTCGRPPRPSGASC